MVTISKLRCAVRANRGDVIRKLLKGLSKANRASSVAMINRWRDGRTM